MQPSHYEVVLCIAAPCPTVCVLRPGL